MQRRRTGGNASYPPLGESYTLNPSVSTTIKGGGHDCLACNSGGGAAPPRRRGGYYAADITKNTGSANDSSSRLPGLSGGARRRRGGAPVELTAFISALALLGARLLADKNSSFNFFSQGEQNFQEQVGGRPRRTRRA